MKLIILNPTVAPHVQQTVIAYFEAGYLDKFYTSFFDHPENKFSSYFKKIGSIEKEVRRRAFDQLPIDKFSSRPIPELLRIMASKKAGPLITDKIWEWSELGFDKWVAGKITSKIDAVHTYEHAALATLQRAKELNIFSIYEQPSQHHAFFNNIALEQMELYPSLKTEASALLVNTKAVRRNKRRDEELELATIIICNSSFTKKTLIKGGVNADKICIIPLAFPAVSTPKPVTYTDKPLIFLYAGNQSLRKGSHILYDAWRKCEFKENEAELWMVGRMNLPEELRKDLPGKVVIKENIPHSEMMKLYKQADVFVLPTLADGFGMVVTEAMSQGLPVIASENSCGPDIIEHMKDGWAIPAGSTLALINQMKWCVLHRKDIPKFGVAARQKATNWQWPQYRKELAKLIFDKWQLFQQSKLSV
jgi:glycosyltransferase involved in cell wall biosynthesis